MNLTQKLIASGFLLAGLINLLPVIGLSGLPQLQQLYGLNAVDADTVLLLQHRALLLGMVGFGLVAAALRSELRPAAAAAGLASMAGYLLLVFMAGTENPKLLKVAWVDVAAVVILAAAFAAQLIQPRGPDGSPDAPGTVPASRQGRQSPPPSE